VNPPQLNDYLRLYALYGGREGLRPLTGAERERSDSEVSLLFRQVVRMIRQRSTFNRTLPLSILLQVHGLATGRPAVRIHFRESANRRRFLIELGRYLEQEGALRGGRRHSRGESLGSV